MRRFIRALAIAVAILAPAWASADDQQIAQQIAGSLRSSGQLVDYSIGVKFENGTAWLLGRVANEDQRDRAIALARKMPSVTDVVSKLEIKSTIPTAGRRANRPGNSPATNRRLQFTGDSSACAGREASQAEGQVVSPRTRRRDRRGQQGEIDQTAAAEDTPQPSATRQPAHRLSEHEPLLGHGDGTSRRGRLR